MKIRARFRLGGVDLRPGDTISRAGKEISRDEELQTATEREEEAMTRKLQVWSPFGDVWDLQDEVNRLFRSFGGGMARRNEEGTENALWAPSVDIAEDKEEVRITAELPGMKQGDVKINVENGVLTLRGERMFSDETK